MTPNGNVPSIAPLFEVKTISDGTAGTFAEVHCVGRARLRERRGDGRATISPFGDASSDVDRLDSDGPAVALLRRVVELHEACHALDQELAKLQQAPEFAPSQRPAHELQSTPPRVGRLGGDPTPHAQRGVTASVRMARRPVRFSSPLGDVINRQRETLLGQAAAQCMWPSPSLERLPLWTGSEGPLASQHAELVLASFAASASLSPFERLRCVALPAPSFSFGAAWG